MARMSRHNGRYRDAAPPLPTQCARYPGVSRIVSSLSSAHVAMECSAPFFLSTWKRVGVVRHERAGPGLAAGVRFRARRHGEHGAARGRSPGHGRGRMVVMTSFPGG
jgi:hypothetical protein